jgi:hypothetical protein
MLKMPWPHVRPAVTQRQRRCGGAWLPWWLLFRFRPCFRFRRIGAMWGPGARRGPWRPRTCSGEAPPDYGDHHRRPPGERADRCAALRNLVVSGGRRLRSSGLRRSANASSYMKLLSRCYWRPYDEILVAGGDETSTRRNSNQRCVKSSEVTT